MSWRYQAVWRDIQGERVFSVCELHFDDADRLDGWTESAEMWPGGGSFEELSRDLIAMYVDCARWAPIDFTTLAVGAHFDSFTKLISRLEAESLAEMFEQIPQRAMVQGTA